MSDQEENESILSHPDVRKVVDTVFSTLIAESHRGAALIGSEIVSQHLTDLLRERASSDASKNTLDRLLEYPGALSSFSAKADVALAFGLLSKNTHESINVLRRIRNDAAHSKRNFTLSNHRDRLREVLQLGPGMEEFITEMAARVISTDTVEKAWEVNQDFEQPLYDSREALSEDLRDDSDIMETLDQKLPKAKLGIAVAMICGEIVHSRDRKQDKE